MGVAQVSALVPIHEGQAMEIFHRISCGSAPVRNVILGLVSYDLEQLLKRFCLGLAGEPVLRFVGLAIPLLCSE